MGGRQAAAVMAQPLAIGAGAAVGIAEAVEIGRDARGLLLVKQGDERRLVGADLVQVRLDGGSIARQQQVTRVQPDVDARGSKVREKSKGGAARHG